MRRCRRSGPNARWRSATSDIVHGQTLTLGDTTLTFTVLFGHSAGSLGIFIPVKWRGQSHVVWLHGGGLHHPNRDSLARLDSVIKDYALKMNAEALLNTHPGIYQDTLADMEAIRRNPTGPNPVAVRAGPRGALLGHDERLRPGPRHRPRAGPRPVLIPFNWRKHMRALRIILAAVHPVDSDLGPGAGVD